MGARLAFAETAKEKCIVRNGFLDELLEQEELGAIDDGVNAHLKRLHRRKSLEGAAKENHGRVTALGHGHGLKRLQSQILAQLVGSEQFLNDHNLVADLAEPNQKIAVGGRGVNLITEFGETGFGGVEPFRS